MAWQRNIVPLLSRSVHPHCFVVSHLKHSPPRYSLCPPYSAFSWRNIGFLPSLPAYLQFFLVCISEPFSTHIILLSSSSRPVLLFMVEEYGSFPVPAYPPFLLHFSFPCLGVPHSGIFLILLIPPCISSHGKEINIDRPSPPSLPAHRPVFSLVSHFDIILT